MANTYQWAVNTLTAYPQHEGEQNVVFQVAWVCSATDGTYNVATYGGVDVTYTSDQPFTPYNDLTLEQVNGWVADALGTGGIAEAQASCDAMIEAQRRTDEPVSLPLPWNVLVSTE